MDQQNVDNIKSKRELMNSHPLPEALFSLAYALVASIGVPRKPLTKAAKRKDTVSFGYHSSL